MSFHVSSTLGLPRFLRSLRMRLTISYVLFFALVLAGAGLLFQKALDSMVKRQSRQLLEQEWGDALAYLNLSSVPPTWLPHSALPGEGDVVSRLRQCIRMESLDGRVWEVAPEFEQFSDYSSQDRTDALAARRPLLRRKHGAQGDTYFVLMGRAKADGREFFLAIGVPVQGPIEILSTFVRAYFLLLPAVLFVIALIGWLLARRALKPVQELAAAADQVSGGHLDVRLAEHGTGDELDALIRTFNRMMERLELSFSQMRQFSVNASHELRTPITTARGNLEVALLSARSVEEYREAVSGAVADLERVSQLVSSLLMLAQAESGQLRLHLRRQDVAALMENVLSQYRLAAEEKGVLLDAQMPERHFAEVDRQQFERMVASLLSNAVRYTPAGGEVRVRLSRSAGTDGEIRISVADTGPGISGAHQQHLFDRLYKVREGALDPSSGLGLGLSFALWAAQSHGGRIELDSAPGRGSTFTVVLPSAQPEPAPQAAPSQRTTS